ncbi:MAG: SDR family NAD(P)-dependent oxidoreductase [Janthinobacterium lividum]
MTERPTTLITGASSGIGEALADLLANSGHDLVLVARRQDRLQQTADRLRASGARVEVLIADLSTDDGIQRTVDRIDEGDLEHLVNNAGVGGYAPFATVCPTEVRQLWTVNATAPLLLARAALPHLLTRERGGIITIASLLALSAGQDASYLPSRTIYAAAKAAGVAFTRTLTSELIGTGVHATVVLPGRVQTEFSGGAAKQDPQAMTASDVAVAAWKAHTQGEGICVPGLEDAAAIADLIAAEGVLLAAGNRPELAFRYAPSPH